MNERAVELWYVTPESYEVELVTAYARQGDYFWVPSKGYSVALGVTVFRDERVAVDTAMGRLAQLIASHQAQYRRLERKRLEIKGQW